MPSSTPVSREIVLQQIETRLEREPGLVELRVERARLLIEMERLDEAKNILLEILTQNPAHLVALNNLGALLNIMGYHKAAQKVYREVVTLSPDNIKCRMNYAQTLREAAEMDEAHLQYKTVLEQSPDHAEAHRGLAYVLKYLRQDEAAWGHWRKGAGKPTSGTRPAEERDDRLHLLVLSSPCGGNSPITRFLGQNDFRASYLVPDFYGVAAPLPRHQLVINAIGDADHCGPSLDSLAAVLSRTAKPIINSPDRIRTTGRVDNASLLGGLEGVVTPRIVSFSSEILAGTSGPSALAQQGLTFPVLLRTPGFHEGNHFVRVDKPDALASAVALLPGRKLMAIQYLDARDDDGKIRKFRVMMIDGKLYPMHKAVSPKWMVHYYSADMANCPEHRAEDEAFLDDMPHVVGARAMQALESIRDTLGLDYAGADFSLGRQGEVLLFEANATMSAPAPEKGGKWDYRRDPVERVRAAAVQMIRSRAKAPLA